MQLEKQDVIKSGVELYTANEFAEKFGDDITPQGLRYAIMQDKVDFVQLGRQRFIVMTDKTRSYTPNSHPTRSEEK